MFVRGYCNCSLSDGGTGQFNLFNNLDRYFFLYLDEGWSPGLFKHTGSYRTTENTVGWRTRPLYP